MSYARGERAEDVCKVKSAIVEVNECLSRASAPAIWYRTAPESFWEARRWT
jgi:hypothetical protein